MLLSTMCETAVPMAPHSAKRTRDGFPTKVTAIIYPAANKQRKVNRMQRRRRGKHSTRPRPHPLQYITNLSTQSGSNTPAREKSKIADPPHVHCNKWLVCKQKAIAARAHRTNTQLTSKGPAARPPRDRVIWYGSVPNADGVQANKCLAWIGLQYATTSDMKENRQTYCCTRVALRS